MTEQEHKEWEEYFRNNLCYIFGIKPSMLTSRYWTVHRIKYRKQGLRQAQRHWRERRGSLHTILLEAFRYERGRLAEVERLLRGLSIAKCDSKNLTTFSTISGPPL